MARNVFLLNILMPQFSLWIESHCKYPVLHLFEIMHINTGVVIKNIVNRSQWPWPLTPECWYLINSFTKLSSICVHRKCNRWIIICWLCSSCFSQYMGESVGWYEQHPKDHLFYFPCWLSDRCCFIFCLSYFSYRQQTCWIALKETETINW